MNVPSSGGTVRVWGGARKVWVRVGEVKRFPTTAAAAGIDVIVDTTHPIYVVWVLESRIGANAPAVERQLNSQTPVHDVAEIVRRVAAALSTMAVR
ncbi:hypothetical protein [Embleya sp. NPDC059237]|uniref:hypothetical protein n=1 Tax=Embleya sp. NPDC059237 TaxID=3346784 RepID=UPI003675D275